MNVDKITIPKYFNVVMEDKLEYLNELRDQAEVDGQNEVEEDIKKLALREEGHTFNTEEYYFENGNLWYSGYMNSKEGNTYVTFEIPISDDILIDILQHASKKFNKLKTALESLK